MIWTKYDEVKCKCQATNPTSVATVPVQGHSNCDRCFGRRIVEHWTTSWVQLHAMGLLPWPMATLPVWSVHDVTETNGFPVPKQSFWDGYYSSWTAHGLRFNPMAV